MSIITTGAKAPGLDKGYPKVTRRLEGSRVVRGTQLRVLFHTDDPAETGIALEQQIYLLYPEFAVGYDLGSGFKIRQTALARDEGNRLLHYLDVSADDQITDQEKEDKDKPPDQRKAKHSWDFETAEHAFLIDLDGNPVQNSAEDPIEVTEDFEIPVLTIEKQQAIFEPETILNFVNHVNSGEFWGAPSRAVLCAGIRDTEGETFNGVEFRRVTYVFKFIVVDIPDVVEGWKLLLVDHGPNELDIVNNVKTAIKDESGSKITANLNSLGQAMDPGEDPHILKFRRKPDADFSSLNINWPLT